MDATRVTAADWPVLRDVRLQALEESPHAFGQTLAQARALPDEEWAAAQSVRRLNFWVAEKNPEAAAFYRRLGYADTGTRNSMSSGSCANAFLYERELARVSGGD